MRPFEWMTIGCCWMAVNLVVVGFSAVIHRIPALAWLLRRWCLGFLSLSYRLYHRVLATTAPFFWNYLRIRIARTFPRVIASILTSLLIMSVLFLVLDLTLRPWLLWLAGLHGALVGWAWENLEAPDGLRLGVGPE